MSFAHSVIVQNGLSANCLLILYSISCNLLLVYSDMFTGSLVLEKVSNASLYNICINDVHSLQNR